MEEPLHNVIVDPLNVMVSGGSSDLNSLMDDKIKIIMTVSKIIITILLPEYFMYYFLI